MNVAAQWVESAYDAVKEVADEVGRGPGGRELSLAITKLEEAGFWLHKARDRGKES